MQLPLVLKMTCFACPEQYDVYERVGDELNQVAYFRDHWLREGCLAVLNDAGVKITGDVYEIVDDE